MDSSVFMCLKVSISILDFESSESAEQGRPTGFQGPKTDNMYYLKLPVSFFVELNDLKPKIDVKPFLQQKLE